MGKDGTWNCEGEQRNQGLQAQLCWAQNLMQECIQLIRFLSFGPNAISPLQEIQLNEASLYSSPQYRSQLTICLLLIRIPVFTTQSHLQSKSLHFYKLCTFLGSEKFWGNPQDRFCIKENKRLMMSSVYFIYKYMNRDEAKATNHQTPTLSYPENIICIYAFNVFIHCLNQNSQRSVPKKRMR